MIHLQMKIVLVTLTASFSSVFDGIFLVYCILLMLSSRSILTSRWASGIVYIFSVLRILLMLSSRSITTSRWASGFVRFLDKCYHKCNTILFLRSCCSDEKES